MQPSLVWPEQDVETLVKLWPTHSAKEIGALMGRTRNSVIGKVNRMALPMKREKLEAVRKRTPTVPKAPRVRKPLPPRQRVEPMVIAAPEPVNGGLHILELEHNHCKEVIGYGTPDLLARYCGHDRKDGSSFCQFHHAKNYNPTPYTNQR